jgi:hypothetical protein
MPIRDIASKISKNHEMCHAVNANTPPLVGTAAERTTPCCDMNQMQKCRKARFAIEQQQVPLTSKIAWNPTHKSRIAKKGDHQNLLQNTKALNSGELEN